MHHPTSLVCPFCHKLLSDGGQALHCDTHGSFPVVDGVPSFVGDHAFDRHWDSHADTSIAKPKKLAAREFLKPLIDRAGPKQPVRLLDAGCGDGVHAVVLDEENLPADTQFIGVDVSLPALSAARNNVTGGWFFVHADICKLPFEDGYFDSVFSFGVLEYTDQPAHSFDELCRVLAPGGVIGVWVLARQSFLVDATLGILRRLCRLTGKLGSHLIANAIVPFLRFAPSRTGLNLHNASWQQCRESVLVNIASPRLFMSEPSEVKAWFDNNGIELFYMDTDTPITFWGKNVNKGKSHKILPGHANDPTG